jgi:group II intron-encoded protein ltrA
MKSTMEILTKLQENSQKNHDEIFTRLYRYLLRPDIYFIAYQHLYSNKGAGTKGVNDDTADGFSEQYVTAIIEALRTGSYEPKPVRRTYIQKKNGKLRPLGLPVFADKLVQESYPYDSGSHLRADFLYLFPRLSTGQKLPHGTCHDQA